MSTVNPGLLDELGLDADDFKVVATDPDIFKSRRSTVNMAIGQPVNFTAKIGKSLAEYEATATLKQARLVSLTKMRQKSPSKGNEYTIVSGEFRPVQMDLSLVIDGEQVPVWQFLMSLAHPDLEVGTDEHEAASVDFLRRMKNIGLDYVGDRYMFFQHFGAHEDATETVLQMFADQGAADVTNNIPEQRRGRIRKRYALKEGLEVTAIEVGSANRERSKTKQGFLDFAQAEVDNYARATAGIRAASAEDAKASELRSADAPESDIEAQVEKSTKRYREATRWINNISGAQERIEETNGTLIPQGTFDPVSALIGTFTVKLNDGSDYEVNLWKNSQETETTTPAAATTGGNVVTLDPNEEPFK